MIRETVGAATDQQQLESHEYPTNGNDEDVRKLTPNLIDASATDK